MLWFNIKERKKKMEYIQNFVPTSKAQLLQVCLYYNNGDLKKAQEMFDFYNNNLNLPDFDPIAPSFVQQVKSGASDIFSWFKDNQADIVKGYQLIQSVIANKGVLPISDVPAEPLPPINEM